MARSGQPTSPRTCWRDPRRHITAERRSEKLTRHRSHPMTAEYGIASFAARREARRLNVTRADGPKPPDTHTHTHTHTHTLLSCFVIACCHGYCTSQCSDLAQLAPTSKGLSINPYVQRLTLHWITLSTLLMMAHKAETAVQGWSVDPMEAVILTHRVLAARSTVRLSESLAVGKSFSLVLWSLVVMVTAQASVVILLSLHPQARGWA